MALFLLNNGGGSIPILWTGGLSYAPYRSLSISKLFGMDGGGGLEGFVLYSQPTSGGGGGGPEIF
jgi:hypothetical protein